MERIVIISTKNFSRRNSLVRMGGEPIRFDANCTAEVTESVATLLCGMFKDDIRIVGKSDDKPSSEQKLASGGVKDKVPELLETIEKLQKEVVRLNTLLNEKFDYVERSKEEHVESQSVEEEELSSTEPIDPNPKIELSEDEIRAKKLEIKRSYISFKKADLVDVVRQAGLPESEWGELNKDNLLDYIVNKMFESSQKVD